MVLEDIFAVDGLDELRRRLDSSAGRKLRGALLREFWKVCRYRNAEEWNRAVRLCEGLAIVGWGDCEPVQACCGEDWTNFQNRFGEHRFVSAVWSKRKGGVTIRPGEATYHASPDQPGVTGEFSTELCVQNVRLASQRNWIPKNPIRLYQWLDNSDATTRPLVDSINDQLVKALDQRMNPVGYGPAIDQIWIDFYFCSQLRGCPETYIVIDEDTRLSSVQLHRRLLTMYSATQIKRENLFLRKRFEYGNFRPEKGTMKVTLHFPREFNELSLREQKREFARELSTAVGGVVERLSGRDLDYDLSQMERDFQLVLAAWVKKTPGK